jgi:hypothetical protein
VAALGVHKGALACAHLIQWAMTTAELGEVPTVEQYAESWAVTERTGWRHAAELRAVFGEDWRAAVEDLSHKVTTHGVRTPRAGMELPLPSTLATA